MSTILVLLLAFMPPSPTCGDWSDGFRSTKEVRDDTRERVRHTAKEMGLKKEARSVLMTMVTRESDADPCASHTLGHNELGLGPLGLSVRWTLGHWDRSADPEALMIPEVAAVVAIRIMRRAVRLHGAKSWTEVNSVFATGKIKKRPDKDRKWCKRLARRGIDCNSNPAGQLGKKLGMGKFPNQEKILEEMTREN